MKKFLLMISAVLLTVSALAQQVTNLSDVKDGYYRVYAVKGKRYLSLLDNKGWAKRSGANPVADLYAIRTLLDNSDNHIVSNPATVIRITPSSTEYTCSAQGTSINNFTSYKFKISKSGNAFIISAEAAGVGKSILAEGRLYSDEKDAYLPDSGVVSSQGANFSDGSRDLYLYKVSSSDANSYFGFAPDVNVGSKYYQTTYFAFPFKLASGSKATVYRVTKVLGSSAIIEPFGANDVVPAATPLLVESSSNNAADNKVDLQLTGGSASGTNLLAGVYFRYVYTDNAKAGAPSSSNSNHRNLTKFDASSMRVLGSSNGSAVFTTASTPDYIIPANSAYLKVPAGTATELKIRTKVEYTRATKDVNMDATVDISDVQTVINEMPTNASYCDVNSDGIVDISDVQSVINNINM
jgi:hypothetical protein